MEHRLRRNAAHVQACATDILLLDDADARAKLRGPDRRDIAADAGADHQDIELSLFVRHCLLLCATSGALNPITRPASAARGDCRHRVLADRAPSRAHRLIVYAATPLNRSAKQRAGLDGAARSAYDTRAGSGRIPFHRSAVWPSKDLRARDAHFVRDGFPVDRGPSPSGRWSMRPLRLPATSVPSSKPASRRVAAITALATLFTMLVLIQAALFAPGAHAAAPHVDVVAFDRAVDPAGARYLTDAIQTAESDGATALVIDDRHPRWRSRLDGDDCPRRAIRHDPDHQLCQPSGGSGGLRRLLHRPRRASGRDGAKHPHRRRQPGGRDRRRSRLHAQSQGRARPRSVDALHPDRLPPQRRTPPRR